MRNINYFFHMVVMEDERKAIEELDRDWDYISTLEGIQRYLSILGPRRTALILLASRLGVKVHVSTVGEVADETLKKLQENPPKPAPYGDGEVKIP